MVTLVVNSDHDGINSEGMTCLSHEYTAQHQPASWPTYFQRSPVELDPARVIRHLSQSSTIACRSPENVSVGALDRHKHPPRSCSPSLTWQTALPVTYLPSVPEL